MSIKIMPKTPEALVEELKNLYQKRDQMPELIPGLREKVPQKIGNYINLSIIPQEKNESHPQSEIHHDSQAAIRLEQLFHAQDPSKPTEVRRIRIIGSPGMGKSTLARYAAYQCNVPDNQLWNEYQYVFSLPLRILREKRFCKEETLTLQGVLCAHYGFLKSDYEETIKNILEEGKHRGKVLLIADGYDEIAPVFSPRSNTYHAISSVIEEILGYPSLIVTSRPNVMPSDLKFDKALQITGFTYDNMVNYIKSRHEDADAQELIKLLESSKNLVDIARIPIQLVLICTLWDENKKQGSIQTQFKEHLSRTHLYDMLLKMGLLRYYRERNTESQKETRGSVPSLFSQQINNECDKELYFLEDLAFNAMQKNELFLSSSLIRKIYQKKEHQGVKELLQYLPATLLFRFRGNGIEVEEEDAYFIHKTILEMMAARYVVRRLQMSTDSKEFYWAIDFVEKHRYLQHYQVMYEFMAGLVGLLGNDKAGEASPALSYFWDTLLTSMPHINIMSHIKWLFNCLEHSRFVQTEKGLVIDPRIKRSDQLIKMVKLYDIAPSSSSFYKYYLLAEELDKLVSDITRGGYNVNYIRCDSLILGNHSALDIAKRLPKPLPQKYQKHSQTIITYLIGLIAPREKPTSFQSSLSKVLSILVIIGSYNDEVITFLLNKTTTLADDYSKNSLLYLEENQLSSYWNALKEVLKSKTQQQRINNELVGYDINETIKQILTSIDKIKRPRLLPPSSEPELNEQNMESSEDLENSENMEYSDFDPPSPIRVKSATLIDLIDLIKSNQYYYNVDDYSDVPDVPYINEILEEIYRKKAEINQETLKEFLKHDLVGIRLWASLLQKDYLNVWKGLYQLSYREHGLYISLKNMNEERELLLNDTESLLQFITYVAESDEKGAIPYLLTHSTINALLQKLPSNCYEKFCKKLLTIEWRGEGDRTRKTWLDIKLWVDLYKKRPNPDLAIYIGKMVKKLENIDYFTDKGIFIKAKFHLLPSAIGYKAAESLLE